MRCLTLAEVLELHRRVMEQAGGSPAVRDLGGLISAVAQPRMTFEGRDLHRTAEDKAAALCFSIIVNHPFVDGHRRAGHAAMETFQPLAGDRGRQASQPTEIVGARPPRLKRDVDA